MCRKQGSYCACVHFVNEENDDKFKKCTQSSSSIMERRFKSGLLIVWVFFHAKCQTFQIISDSAVLPHIILSHVSGSTIYPLLLQ